MKYADTLKAALDTATQAREAFDAAPKGEGNIVMWQAHSVLDEARAEISDLLVNKGPELLRLIEAATVATSRDADHDRRMRAMDEIRAELAALAGGEPDGR